MYPVVSGCGVVVRVGKILYGHGAFHRKRSTIPNYLKTNYKRHLKIHEVAGCIEMFLVTCSS